MKRKRARIEKPSAGTVLAARARAEGNKWTDAERDRLGEQFMKLYFPISPASRSALSTIES